MLCFPGLWWTFLPAPHSTTASPCGHSPGWQWHIPQSAEQHWTVSEQTGKSASALGCVCHNLVALRISGKGEILNDWPPNKNNRDTTGQHPETRGEGYRKRVKVLIENIQEHPSIWVPGGRWGGNNRKRSLPSARMSASQKETKIYFDSAVISRNRGSANC